jgi:hypothetical protein
MAFTPEQIAKAYAGAQGDIYEAFQNQEALQAKRDALEAAYKKQELNSERQDNKVRDAAMTSVLAAQKAANLATGTQLDPLWNNKAKEIYSRAFSPEGMALFNVNPGEWKSQNVLALQGVSDQMKSVEAGAKKALQMAENYNKNKGGILDLSKLNTAVINTVGLDENGKPRDSFNSEESVISAIVNGYIDPVTHKEIKDPYERDKIASSYYDKDMLNQKIQDKFKAEMKKDESPFMENGRHMVMVNTYPNYYRVNQDTRKPELDVVTVTDKNKNNYTLASDNLRNVLNYPDARIAIALHKKDLLETEQGQKAFENLSKDQFNDYVIADYAKTLPFPTSEKKAQDQAYIVVNTGGKKEKEPHDSLDYIQSIYVGDSNPDITKFNNPTPYSYSEATLPKGEALTNLHDITHTSSKALLKDSDNISYKVWKSDATGKYYYTFEKTTGGGSAKPTWVGGSEKYKGKFFEVPDVNWFNRFPAKQFASDTHKTYGGGTAAPNATKPGVAAQSNAVVTQSTGGFDWAGRSKKAEEEKAKAKVKVKK